MENVSESRVIFKRRKCGFHRAMKNEYIMENIFSHLSLSDIKNCRAVNRTWRQFGARILRKRTRVVFNFIEPSKTEDDEKYKAEKMKKFKTLVSHCFKLRPENFPFSSFDIQGYMALADITKLMEAAKMFMKEFELRTWLTTGSHQRVFDINPLISQQLTKLHIVLTIAYDRLSLSFNMIPLVKDLHLDGCVLHLTDLENRLSPSRLYLGDGNSYIVDGGEWQFLVNQIFDLKWTEYLNLNGTNIALDFSDCVNDKIERTVLFNHVNVQQWGLCDWKIDKLTLNDVPFVNKNLIEMKELEIYESVVDLSMIQYPLSLTKLSCPNCTTIVTENLIPFPNLVHLSLEYETGFRDLRYFTNNTKIKDLRLGEVNKSLILSHTGRVYSLRLPVIPYGVKDLTLRSLRIRGEYLLHLRTLRLIEYRPFSDYISVMAKFRCPTAVIYYSDFYNKREVDNVIPLLKADAPYRRKRLIIGPFCWDCNTKKSKLFKYVDKEAEYYMFKGTKGRALTDKEFSKYYDGFEKHSYMY